MDSDIGAQLPFRAEHFQQVARQTESGDIGQRAGAGGFDGVKPLALAAAGGGRLAEPRLHESPRLEPVGKRIRVVLGGFIVLMVVVIAAVVFVERGHRRVTVQYAKRMVGRRVYGGASTHIPLKVNTGGVMPVIFASSILAFPQTLQPMFPVGSFMDANPSSRTFFSVR